MKFVRLSERIILNIDEIISLHVRKENDAYLILLQQRGTEHVSTVKTFKTDDQALAYLDCIFIKLGEKK